MDENETYNKTMIKTQNSSDRLVRFFVLMGEIVLLTLVMIGIYLLYWREVGNFPPHFKRLLVLMALCYSICQLYVGVVVHQRFITGDVILKRMFQTFLLFMLLSMTVLWVFRWPLFSWRFMVPLYGGALVVILMFRLFIRWALKRHRSEGRNTNFVVFVGDVNPIADLFNRMAQDRTTGYCIHGYFADESVQLAMDKGVEYWGTPQQFSEVMTAKNRKVDYVYCTLEGNRRSEIYDILGYCEAHLVRFCSIPTTFNYVKHTMSIEMMANTPVLSIHNEPLESMSNRFMKRVFDIIFSLCVLILIFPWVYIIFGTWIKLSSPGPVFFKQKRSGLGGKEFWCYKFRSMRQSADADSKQATRDDPRKTRVGELMRKTSIDELPQFINVLRGEMSVVGPRPHMLKHTEQYSEIIESYMVRHFVKPGITGYAQVTGYRGETSELWQMEGRVQRDIWYIEHWGLSLDIFIIYKTVANALGGEDKAY